MQTTNTHQSNGYFTHEQLSNPNFKFSKHPLLFVPQDKVRTGPITMHGRSWWKRLGYNSPCSSMIDNWGEKLQRMYKNEVIELYKHPENTRKTRRTPKDTYLVPCKKDSGVFASYYPTYHDWNTNQQHNIYNKIGEFQLFMREFPRCDNH